jgi:hypothetical protein
MARIQSDSGAYDEMSTSEMSADVAMYENNDALETKEGKIESEEIGSMVGRDEFVVLTQVNVIPIKLSVSNSLKDMDVSESVQMSGKNNRLSKSRNSPLKKEAGKAPSVATAEPKATASKPLIDSLTTKPKVKGKPYISRFKLQHNEDESSNAHIELKSGSVPTEIQLILFNIWGDNPLIFEIEGIYYLDLGQNGPWVSKGGSGIWKIPEEKGNYGKIEWVKSKAIIEQIRN